MSAQFPVKGGKEIDAFLSALPKKLEKQAIRSALVAAAAPVRDEARLLAPKQSGKMAKSIKTGSARQNQDGTFSVSIRLQGPHSFLGIMHEYGVAPHLIASTGKGEGRVAVRKASEGDGAVKNGVMMIGTDFVSGIIQHPGVAAHPFMRPALDNKAPEAIKAFTASIRASLEAIKSKTGYDAVAGVNSLDEAA